MAPAGFLNAEQIRRRNRMQLYRHSDKTGYLFVAYIAALPKMQMVMSMGGNTLDCTDNVLTPVLTATWTVQDYSTN